MKKQYLTCCVNSTAEKINKMVDQAKEISYKTFISHVEIEDLKNIGSYSWGREKGLHLKDDWAVSYYKSVYCGKPCVYMNHSMIEYIFV